MRFPAFRKASAWATIELRKLSRFVTERVAATNCTPCTITSGTGLVSQQGKTSAKETCTKGKGSAECKGDGG